MTACAAYGCINRPSMKKPGVTFHSFPKDEERRKQWLVAISREDWTPSKSSKVCSEHFLEEMIDRTSLSCVRLKENAVPRLAFDEDSPIINVEEVYEQNLNEELHKNAESASLIIQELFSIEGQTSESENEIPPVKVKTMSIHNSVCIRQETRSDVKHKTNYTSPSTAVQNLVSASLESRKRRKASASVAGQTSVSGAINENEESESNEHQNTNQSGKHKKKARVQKSISATPNADNLAIQKITKDETSPSTAVQNSPNAPDLNSITNLIEAIKCSSGNTAKIVVIEGIKNKDSAQKRKIAKLKKALKAERKKVKMLRQKIKTYQKTLSNVTDLLNDIKNQKIDEQG